MKSKKNKDIENIIYYGVIGVLIGYGLLFAFGMYFIISIM
jgi:hypothetical protein